MKKTIRMNERELHNLISESVKRVLNDMDEGVVRDAINGLRDTWHAWTDKPEQFLTYKQGRRYDDALDAQRHDNLTPYQQRTLDKGNAKLQQMKDNSQKRVDNKREEFITNNGDNTYGRQGGERYYNAQKNYHNQLRRNDKMQQIKNPYNMSKINR